MLHPSRALARLAGILYLVVGIAGGFAQLGVRSSVLVIGDAAATADRIRESSDVVRLGFVADVVNVTAFILLAFVLYRLLSPVSQHAAAAFVVLNAIAAAVMGVSLIGHAGALLLATDATYAAALGTVQADTLSHLFLELHAHGYLVAEVFFGLWLVPLGYAVYRSGYFPRVIGPALAFGGLCYLATFTITVLSPGFQPAGWAPLVAMPAGIAEVGFLLWLLVRGASLPVEGSAARRRAEPVPA